MSNYEGAFGGNTENVNEKNPWEGLADVEPNRQLESFGSDSEMVDVPSIQTRELDGFGSEPSKERVPDDVKRNDGPKVVFREFGTNGDEREFDAAPKNDESTMVTFNEFGTDGGEKTFREDLKKDENVPDGNQELKPFGSE